MGTPIFGQRDGRTAGHGQPYIGTPIFGQRDGRTAGHGQPYMGTPIFGQRERRTDSWTWPALYGHTYIRTKSGTDGQLDMASPISRLVHFVLSTHEKCN
jgi:hypothetical protein